MFIKASIPLPLLLQFKWQRLIMPQSHHFLFNLQLFTTRHLPCLQPNIKTYWRNCNISAFCGHKTNRIGKAHFAYQYKK